MATSHEHFYGCLCLETSYSNRPLSAIDGREKSEIPFPEIHFNIWEEGASTAPFLDIGIMLAVNDPAEQIEIFLPWVLEEGKIEDLSPRILASDGVSAIFNEAWASTAISSNPGGFVTQTDKSIFTIVPYNSPKISNRKYQNEFLHSIVFNVGELRTTSDAAAATAPSPPSKMYVRIRVKNVPPRFYQVGIDQGDAFGGGTLNRTEIIDFRLNVRRGVPQGIESILNGRFMSFSKVQLFIMKSRDQDIVFEDKLFRACRSLEDEKFWAKYILPPSPSEDVMEESSKQVRKSLGYQWKKTPENGQKAISEFGMLARFKSFKIMKGKMIVYIAIALIIGAISGVLGNSLYDLGKWVFIHF